MEPSSLPFSLRMGLFVATAGNFLPFVPPAAHFSQQLEKWAKEPEETNGFFTSLRAIRCTKPRLPTTRSRKLFFFALLKGSTLLQRRCR